MPPFDRSDPTAALAAGRDALVRGAWEEAVRAFATVTTGLSGPDPHVAEAWQGLGLASYWLEDATTAIEAHERAFDAWQALGQPSRAARMALWLADDHVAFHGAVSVANGWVERAARLLASSPSSAEHAWLEVYRGHYELQMEHDPGSAIATARRAQAEARVHGALEVEIVAIALEGLASVIQGDAAHGMARLDEASAAAVTREPRDLNAVAWALCYLLQGCDTVRDFRRAQDWCLRVVQFCERWGLGPVFYSCRVLYASVLTWQGEWDSAEAQIRSLVGDRTRSLPSGRLSAQRLALVRLAELRRRQGRLSEAEALLDGAGEHRLAILGRANVALSQGQLELAIDLADRVLRGLPPDARAERVDALLVKVLSVARRGDPSAASRELSELEATAGLVTTEPLIGAAALARGAVAAAAGDPAAAAAAYEEALTRYDRGGVPYEAAFVRLELAAVLRDLGRSALAHEEALRARDELARLGAQADVARADAFLVATSARARSSAGVPLTGRELEILRLVGAGHSNPEIAVRLHLSPHTVKRHVANVLRKLNVPSRAAAVATASRLGAL